MTTEDPAASPTVLAVGAHHDDNEHIGGTLALYRRAGWNVVSIVASDGRYINDIVSADHTAIRESESLAAAEIIGMKCVFLRFPEGRFENNAETQLALVREIRRHEPRVVITQPPRDYHIEHERVSRAVRNAVALCWNPCVDADDPSLPPCLRPYLYFHDSWFIPEFRPELWVDVTDTMETRLQMLRCHKSQLGRDAQGRDMLDLSTIQAAYRGAQARVRYAEVFRVDPQRGFISKGHLPGL